MSPWQTLESVRDQAAVRRAWQRRLGDRFPAFRTAFLQARPEPVSLYPCPLDQPCPHRVIHFPDGSIRAVCECPDRHCPDLPLTPDDIVCWQLNWPKLGRLLCAALGFDPKPAELNLYNTRQIGSWSSHALPAFLTIQLEPHHLLFVVSNLVARLRQPFLLLTPTTELVDAAIQELLANAGATLLDLQSHLRLTSQATLEPIEPLPDLTPLTHLTPPAAATPGSPPPPDSAAFCRLLESLHHEIAGVRTEVIELRSAKQHLEQLQAEGLFAFTRKVEPLAFHICCTVLAQGDVAKASRTLDIPDSTLRRTLQEWQHRGAPYKAMLDLVRWRKKIGRKQLLPLNDALFHDKPETTDYPGLFSDVLEGLLSMTEANREERCAELLELLRAAVR